MLDIRIETFLTLCEEQSYTKTAKRLCITQPAVSQHIRFLENHFGVKLFSYKHRTLTLTRPGERFREFAMLSRADWDREYKEMRGYSQKEEMVFGATLTIGEYVMPKLLERVIDRFPDVTLSMLVDNTQTLLQKLSSGEISFAIIEGLFDRNQYATYVFAPAEFVAVCGAMHPFATGQVSYDELCKERLVIREPGSGTRNVLEQALILQNRSIDEFAERIVIGNMNAIKALVSRGIGITFLYLDAVDKELADGSLARIDLDGFEVKRDYHFVFLKGSHFEKEYLSFLACCQEECIGPQGTQ